MEIIIDGKKVEAQYGETILEAAKRNDVYIPTLCHSEALPGLATCRLCMVEIVENGVTKRVASCSYPIQSEIEVVTDNEKLRRIRKTLLKLYYTMAPNSEMIRKLMEQQDVREFNRCKVDTENKCTLCGLCVKACETMGTNAIYTVFRGAAKKVGTPFDEPSEPCIGCGACASVCPTNAIEYLEENGTRAIWGKTFKMVQCKACGKYFATEEEIAYLYQKLGDDIDIKKCETCRKKANANRFIAAIKAEGF